MQPADWVRFLSAHPDPLPSRNDSVGKDARPHPGPGSFCLLPSAAEYPRGCKILMRSGRARPC